MGIQDRALKLYPGYRTVAWTSDVTHMGHRGEGVKGFL